MIRKLSVLTIIIVFVTGCILLSFRLMPAVLPDYKDTVRVFPESEQNRILYVEQNDEIVLYPWDTFHPDNCTEYSLVDAGDRCYGIQWLYAWIYERNEANNPMDSDYFLPSVYFDQQQNTFYIKDYEYQNIDGKTYVLSFAACNGVPVYMDCHLKNDGQTVTDIEALNERLNNMVRESRFIEYLKTEQIAEDDIEEEKSFPAQSSQNPIDRYLVSLTDQSPQGIIDQQIEQIAVAIQNAQQTTAISYNNQILLALSGETTVILFYDSKFDEITGFSIKP